MYITLNQSIMSAQKENNSTKDIACKLGKVGMLTTSQLFSLAKLIRGNNTICNILLNNVFKEDTVVDSIIQAIKDLINNNERDVVYFLQTDLSPECIKELWGLFISEFDISNELQEKLMKLLIEKKLEISTIESLIVYHEDVLVELIMTFMFNQDFSENLQALVKLLEKYIENIANTKPLDFLNDSIGFIDELKLQAEISTELFSLFFSLQDEEECGEFGECEEPEDSADNQPIIADEKDAPFTVVTKLNKNVECCKANSSPAVVSSTWSAIAAKGVSRNGDIKRERNFYASHESSDDSESSESSFILKCEYTLSECEEARQMGYICNAGCAEKRKNTRDIPCRYGEKCRRGEACMFAHPNGVKVITPDVKNPILWTSSKDVPSADYIKLSGIIRLVKDGSHALTEKDITCLVHIGYTRWGYLAKTKNGEVVVINDQSICYHQVDRCEKAQNDRYICCYVHKDSNIEPPNGNVSRF